MRYSTDIVVIDLEASCPAEDQGNNAVERSSIIEIGAVRLDRRSLEITATFSELVRPEDYPIVPFITGITGITAEMVAECDTFDAVGRPLPGVVRPAQQGDHRRLRRLLRHPAAAQGM